MTNYKFSPEGIHDLLMEDRTRYIEVHTHPTEVTHAFLIDPKAEGEDKIPYSAVYSLIKDGILGQSGNVVQDGEWQSYLYLMKQAKIVQESPTMHVYGQSVWHDDVNIVGNREALERLQEAIERALEGDKETGTTGVVFAKDGEGYEVCITLQDGQCHSPEWEDYVAPYNDEMARETAKEGSIIPMGPSGFARKGKRYEFTPQGMKEWEKDRKANG